jgi:succinate dehydrogenase / fumarate reductase iron-sulfur subunit
MIEPEATTIEPTTVETTAAETAVVEPAPAEPAATPAVRLRISRFKQGRRRPHFEEFELRPEPDSTVLDALLEVKRTLDPSLVVRHSCMHGSCGACGVRVNGREVLACDTPLAARPGRRVVVEPLSGQQPIADLAVDMVDFHARMEEVGRPLIRRAEKSADARPPEGIRAFTRFEDCIECGLCLAACPVAASNRRYIGPAALAAAARLVDEPRGHELGPVLALAAEPDSVWRCRDVMECSAVCPAAVEPARSVISLRRRIAARPFHRAPTE